MAPEMVQNLQYTTAVPDLSLTITSGTPGVTPSLCSQVDIWSVGMLLIEIANEEIWMTSKPGQVRIRLARRLPSHVCRES